MHGFLPPPPPTSALGLRLCDDSLRIAVGLRLGSPLCIPHLCPLCGSHIDAFGVHALSCRSSKGRLPRHTALNLIIHKALVSANIPSTLEPRGLSRTDGKRPDGLTITPWSRGTCSCVGCHLLGLFCPFQHHIIFHSSGETCRRCGHQEERNLSGDGHLPPFSAHCLRDNWCFRSRCFRFHRRSSQKNPTDFS